MKTLLKNFTIVTMNENLDVLKDAHLIVEDGKITDVATGAATGAFDEVIDGQNRQVLMPGLVNTHCHVPMVLMRGYGGGHDLNTWLNQYIFPVEDKLTSQSIRAGTALGVAEMIASGITSFADMYYFCDDMAEVTLEAGLNLNLSRGTTVFTPLDDPAAFAPCQEAIALAEKWNGANNGQIKIDFSIHGEYTSFLSPNLWDYLAGYASEHHLGMHVHVSETKAEHEECKARHGGLTPLQVLDAARRVDGHPRHGRSLRVDGAGGLEADGGTGHLCAPLPHLQPEAGFRHRSGALSDGRWGQRDLGHRRGQQQQQSGLVQRDQAGCHAPQGCQSGRHHPAHGRGAQDGHRQRRESTWAEGRCAGCWLGCRLDRTGL